MAPQARLAALTGPVQGREFELFEQEFSIGRADFNSLCLMDPSVSRRHCAIYREGEEFRLRSLQNGNPARVNGLPVEEAPLAHADEIGVGRSRLLFLLGDGAAPLPEEHIASTVSTTVLRLDDALYLRPDWLVNASVPAGSASGESARHLAAMLRAASAIAAAPDLEALVHDLMEALAQAIPAERGAIVLAGDSAPVYCRRRFQPPRSVIRQVLEDGVAVSINDLLGENAENVGESVVRSRINSLLAAPVALGEERLGAIYLDSLDPAVRFNDGHLQLLAGVAGMLAAPLAGALRVRRLQAENARLEAEVRGEAGMVGSSEPMLEVYKFIRKAAPSQATVLIGGESGTGKELVARAIHRNSPRAQKPFVAINCAAITGTLIESEFFGHEKGAFTGAVGQKRGKLEEADGGTVFLDEIGELAPGLQAKLLRVLQEREFERVGGTRPIRVDIRVVAATNRDLAEMARSGAFRQDLYYRLNVVSITLPALRERRDDILPLAAFFLQKYRGSASRIIHGISAGAEMCLRNYEWSGNVRELQNAIERAVVLGTTEEILADDLPDSIVETGDSPGTGGKFHETIREMKRQLVIKALEQSKQSYPEAARLLGLHPNNLHRLMKSLKMK